MAYVSEGLVLDLEKNTYNQIVVKQNDSGKFLLGKIISENTQLDLRNNLVVVNGTKKDGTDIFNPVTVLNDRNIFKLELTESMLSTPGALGLELEIYDADTVVTTMNFTILVVESELNGDLAENTEEDSLAELILEENSIEGSSIKDESISSAKLSTSYTNLVTEITEDKTIDTSTGLLVDQEGSYVTNLIQVRDDNGIICKKLYGNRWDNRLYWVSYKSDGTTMITSELGGEQNDAARMLDVASMNEETYYIRFVGYKDVCDTSDFTITSTPIINLDWLRITENNFKDKIAKKVIEGSTLAIRGTKGFNIIHLYLIVLLKHKVVC